jgi:uncharacterized cupredoxin-like copper-binding protein
MPQRPARLRLPLLLAGAGALLLAACAAPAARTAPPAWPDRTGVQQHTATAPHRHAGPAAHRQAAPTVLVDAAVVRVRMTDGLRFQPAAITVRHGSTVTFLVTNTGALTHEFVIGDLAAQAEHEREMREMGGMPMHDHPNAVSVLPGETRRLTWTFLRRGTMLFGCHVTGHYAAGMKGTVAVV